MKPGPGPSRSFVRTVGGEVVLGDADGKGWIRIDVGKKAAEAGGVFLFDDLDPLSGRDEGVPAKDEEDGTDGIEGDLP